MKIQTIQRPSLLLAACAPVSAVRVRVATDVPQLSWAHQVSANPAGVPAAFDGSYRTTGFQGSNGIESASKRMTDGARGVPPRGRPV